MLLHSTAHLDKKKKKMPLSRNASDPTQLPPVNLSRDDDSYSAHNDARYDPRSNSRYANAASRYQHAKKKQTVPKSPVKPTKVQLPRLSNNRNRLKARVTATTADSSDDDDSDDGLIFHPESKKLISSPHLPNRYDDEYSPVPSKHIAKLPNGTASAGGTAALTLSLNLESVKDKLARMEQQLVVRRKVQITFLYYYFVFFTIRVTSGLTSLSSSASCVH
jgi:hypothetical protein